MINIVTGRILTLFGSLALGMTVKVIFDGETTTAIFGGVLSMTFYAIGLTMLKQGADQQ